MVSNIISLICDLLCALVSFLFLFDINSSFEMFLCIALGTLFLRNASNDLEKIIKDMK